MGGKQIESLKFDFAEVNDVRIHYAHAGEGPLIVFVHGYPRHWYLWRNQLSEFSRDHHAVALDLRGYNLSSKPQGDQNYSVRHNVEDIRALADQLRYDRFTLVGHDIGGAAAFALALHYPERLERIVAMSIPHPAKLEWGMREDENYRQVARYLHGLQSPNAPVKLAANDFAELRPGCLDLPFLDHEDRQAYIEAWSQPGAMEAMLAADRREGFNAGWGEGQLPRGNYVTGVRTHKVTVPTLLMYTEDDFINPGSLFEGTDEWVADLTMKTFPGTHWMPEESPEIVNREIREFIGAGKPAAAPA